MLAERLAHESDPAARVAAQDAMARLALGPPELREALATSPSSHARAWAAHALGNFPDLENLQALMSAAQDPEERVRREIYEALALHADPLAVDTLTRAALRDPSAELRRLAERAAHQVVASPARQVDVPTELALLATGDAAERSVAARNLGRSGDWRVLEPLLAAARDGPEEIRVAALSSLGELGDRRAVPALHELVIEETGRVRHHAIAALAHLRDESSRPVLADLLGDPEVETRKLAVRALGWIGGEGALESMSRALSDPALEVRTEAVVALRDLPGPDRLAALLVAARDPSPFLRAEAVRLLAVESGDAVDPALLRALEDSDALVRLTACEALVTRGVTAAVPRLEELVRTTRVEEERQLYAEALQRLRGGP